MICGYAKLSTGSRNPDARRARGRMSGRIRHPAEAGCGEAFPQREIAADIAECVGATAHGGQIELMADGPGAHFHIELPHAS